ncbi:MAG TPA: IS1380 family transposase, partial [Pirellulales bacterium]|nr:IS1380 family transposase [Pirellulales bacterium]
MNTKIRRQLAARKQRVERRIDKSNCAGCEQPMLRPGNIHYELADRTQGLAYGGIGAMRLLVQELGLAEAIDRRLHLLKIHLPYHESDHVLNLAYNALCDGDCLEDLELRR